MSPAKRTPAVLSPGVPRRVLQRAAIAAAAVLTLTTLLVAGGASPPAGASLLGASTLTICKSSTVTGLFQFSVNSANPISIAAGTCQSLTVENGHNTITELVDSTGATALSSITVAPIIDTVSSSVATRTVTVNIPADNAATVNFTNVPVTRLEVCKVAADSATNGKPFTFSELVGGVSSTQFVLTAQLAPAPPDCHSTPYPAGTAVNIIEQLVSPYEALSITASGGGTLSNLDLAAGTVTATLGGDGTTTVVTYTDGVPPGSLQVCKVAANNFVPAGPWAFTVTDSSGTVVKSLSVPVGQCSPSFQVPAGNYTVLETFSPPDYVKTITVDPPANRISSDPSKGSAVVMVVSGATTAVTYTNDAPVATLEVCKVAGDAATAGNSFPFTESMGGSTTDSFPLKAEQPPTLPNCHSTPYPANAAIDIAEQIPTGFIVADISATGTGSLTNVNPSAGTATATLGGDGTTTVVTYTDIMGPPPDGSLQVCKAAANNFVPAGPWAFTVTDSSGTVVKSLSVAVGQCSPAFQVPVGNYTVRETFSPPYSVKSITVDPPANLISIDLSKGMAVVKVTSGAATTVTYTNDAPVATLEVCKVAGDAATAGNSFPFTESMGGSTTDSFPLTAEQPPTLPNCHSTPYPANAAIDIAEQIPTGFVATDISATGTGSLTNVNLSAGTATATLGGDGTTMVVTYTDDKAPTSGTIKVCKTLAPNGAALAGTTFIFTVIDNASTATETVQVVAPAVGQTNCTEVSSGLPLNSIATVTEQAQANVGLVGVSVAPSIQDAGSTHTVAKVLVETTVASATFTNDALGWIEVCKHPADSITAGHTFTFTVAGGAAFSVAAGQCSQPIQVAAGNVAVDEIQSNPAFYLANVSTEGATDPTGGRLLTGPLTDPATVVVPYGSVGNETVVTFTDAAILGALKICTAQTSLGAALQGRPFTYDYSYTVNGATTVGSVTLFVPAWGATCSAVIGPIDPVNSDGSPVKVTITAMVPNVASVDLANLSYQGNGSVLSSPVLPAAFPTSATFAVGPGMNIVTFVNGATH